MEVVETCDALPCNAEVLQFLKEKRDKLKRKDRQKEQVEGKGATVVLEALNYLENTPAGPLSAPSTFNWSNTTSSIRHHRPSSTGGSTSSSSGCSSFLSGGPFSPNDSLFASPGSNASSNGNISSLQSLSANSSSSIRERDLSLEPDANFLALNNLGLYG